MGENRALRHHPPSAATICWVRHCPSTARSEAGFTGLLSTAMFSSRAAARTLRAAVGGDQDRRNVLAEAAADVADRGDAVAAVEMVVDQQARSRCSPASSIAAIAASGSVTAMTSASQAVSSVFMPSRIAGSFSMQTISAPLIGVRDSGVVLVTAAVWLIASAIGTVTEKTEPPLAIGIERDAVVEHARQPLDDRQPEPEAARDPRALLEAMELLEDLAALERGNADAGVVDADLQRLAAAAAADQHAAARGVFDGVGDEVLQQPPQQRAVGLHRQRAGHEDRARAPWRARSA